MVAQPGRLVGEQPERGRVRLREAEAREADELVVDLVRQRRATPFAGRALDEAVAVGLERGLAPLAAHRPAQPLGLAHREPRERHRHVEHLVLEDDDAERRAERLLEQRMVGRRDVRRVLAQLLAALDVGVDRLALDRPRPHERDLDGHDVVEVLGPRAQDDSASARGSRSGSRRRVGLLDLRVDVAGRRAGCARGRSARRAACAIWSTQSSTAESIPRPSRSILRKPASAQESLSHWHICRPAIAARHHRDELDERARRDHHPARVLRDVARQARDLAAELRERAPARRGEPSLELRAAARAPRPRASRSSRRRRARAARARRTGGRAPCRGRGSRRASGRWRSWPRAPRARGRSARSRATISFSRMSRGKSRSMSGTESSSRLRKRPSERSAATGSTCERPVR